MGQCESTSTVQGMVTVEDVLASKKDPRIKLNNIFRLAYRNEKTKEYIRLLVTQTLKKCKRKELIQFLHHLWCWETEYYMDCLAHIPELMLVRYGDGRTVLHHAIHHRHSQVPRLIELGASLHALTDKGETPLDCAYRLHDISTILHLLKSGASTRIGKQQWLTPTYEDIVSERYIMYLRSPSQLRRWSVLRCHYLSLLYPISNLIESHRRLVIEMLV